MPYASAGHTVNLAQAEMAMDNLIIAKRFEKVLKIKILLYKISPVDQF